MFCKHCGASMNDDAKFCAVCGAPNDTQEQSTSNTAFEQAPTFTFEETTESKKQKADDAKNAMILGIVAAGLSGAVGVGIAGAIVGGIGLKRANEYVEKYGETCQKVKLGHCLSKVGLIVGIVMPIAIVTFYILFFVLYLAMIAIGLSGGF